jgi:hypothetical protein
MSPPVNFADFARYHDFAHADLWLAAPAMMDTVVPEIQ